MKQLGGMAYCVGVAAPVLGVPAHHKNNTEPGLVPTPPSNRSIFSAHSITHPPAVWVAPERNVTRFIPETFLIPISAHPFPFHPTAPQLPVVKYQHLLKATKGGGACEMGDWYEGGTAPKCSQCVCVCVCARVHNHTVPQTVHHTVQPGTQVPPSCPTPLTPSYLLPLLPL